MLQSKKGNATLQRSIKRKVDEEDDDDKANIRRKDISRQNYLNLSIKSLEIWDILSASFQEETWRY